MTLSTPAADGFIAKVRARHSRNRDGECDECSSGMEWGGAPWPCPTYLDTETDTERAERETAEAAEAKAARAAEHVKAYRKAASEQQSAWKRASKLFEDMDSAAAALLAEVDGDVEATAGLLGLTVEDVRRKAKLENEQELHARRAHPAWDYATTEGPRKAWDYADTPPEGDGWERNVDAGREGWERFDYTEESYWRRRKGSGGDG